MFWLKIKGPAEGLCIGSLVVLEFELPPFVQKSNVLSYKLPLPKSLLLLRVRFNPVPWPCWILSPTSCYHSCYILCPLAPSPQLSLHCNLKQFCAQRNILRSLQNKNEFQPTINLCSLCCVKDKCLSRMSSTGTIWSCFLRHHFYIPTLNILKVTWHCATWKWTRQYS